MCNENVSKLQLHDLIVTIKCIPVMHKITFVNS